MDRGGILLSEFDGSEVLHESRLASSLELTSYSYRSSMSAVRDQGRSSMCSCYSIAYVVEYFHRACGAKHPVFDMDYLYSHRASGIGMSFKDAISVMRDVGYRLSGHLFSIHDGVLITSRALLCDFLVSGGPVLMALPVYDSWDGSRFWCGDRLLGYHGVACVGFNPDGVEFINSWGADWGDRGYGFISWGDFGKVVELWGLLF